METDFVLLYLLKKRFHIGIFDRLSLRLNGYDQTVKRFFYMDGGIVLMLGDEIGVRLVKVIFKSRWFYILKLTEDGVWQAHNIKKKLNQRVIITNIPIQLIWFILWFGAQPINFEWIFISWLFRLKIKPLKKPKGLLGVAFTGTIRLIKLFVGWLICEYIFTYIAKCYFEC